MYTCKIVASTQVDALQVIRPLERIVFDGVLLGQFKRHIYSFKNLDIRRECMTHQHHMVNVQKSLCISKDVTENYIIANVAAQIF